jgi:hypothetical protein
MTLPSYDTTALYGEGESRILPQETWDEAFTAVCPGSGTIGIGVVNYLINFEGVEVLKRKMMRDVTIYGIDQIYRALVCEGDHLIQGRIEKPGPKATPADRKLFKLSEEALAFTKGWADRLEYSLKSLCYDFLEAKSYGHKLAEAEIGDFTLDHKAFKGSTLLAPVDIAPKPRTVYRFKVTKANKVLGVVAGGDKDALVPVDNLLIHTVGGMDRDPRGDGVLPSLWGSYQSRLRAKLNQGKASDQTGGGFVVVEEDHPPQGDGSVPYVNSVDVPDGYESDGVTPKTKQVSRQRIAAAAVSQSSTGKTAAMLPGQHVKVVQADGAEIFNQIIDGDNRDIAMAYLGNAQMVFEAKRDSQAAGGKAENVGETMRDAARGHLSATMESAFAKFLRLNFGEKYRGVTPRYDIVTEEGTDILAVSNFLSANFDKLTNDQKNWLASKIGMPAFPEEAEGPDEELQAIDTEEQAKAEEETAQFAATFSAKDRATFKSQTEIANEAAQKRVQAAVRSAHRQFRSLVDSLDKGTRNGKPFDAATFADRFAYTLQVAHERAANVGFKHGGGSELSAEAEEFVATVVANEGSFAQELADALTSGDKSLSQARLAAKRYAAKVGGTANEGFRLASVGGGFTLDWDTNGGVEFHCAECPEYEALSPWQPEELFAVPRGGSTPCRMACQCRLTRSDGKVGFSPVSFD